MPAPKITAPRGTTDVYPPESAEWNRLEAQIRTLAHRFGYGEIRTPMFEATELFVRGVGETTDIVEKEMYTFVDKGGRSMTLRPEWSAPVVRAVLQHNLLVQGALRLYYIGPFFRYERPQAGRYRQANQFGVECFGYAEPEADVEVMQLAMELVLRHGITDAKLQINSIGDETCRPAYRDALLAHFRPHAAQLSEDSQRRLERNPLRLLDSKADADAPFVADAPKFTDYLCGPCRAHFETIVHYLDEMKIPYAIDPLIVRGFDYYTRTVFEIRSSALGSQSALCGGGRYDGLVESLGGPPTPAVGFGLGIERFLMVLRAQGGTGEEKARAAFKRSAWANGRGPFSSRSLPHCARTGRPTFMDYGERKLTAHFKAADRNGARYALIVGDDELAKGEVVLRDLVARSDRRISTAGVAETARASRRSDPHDE